MEVGRMGRAVIFDLDGTLTVPTLDFDAIRAEIGIESGLILEAMAKMDAPRRLQAESIVEAHERRAAEESTLQAGASETIAELAARGFLIGVVTRNARRWTHHVLARHGLTVDGVRCREDGAIKPDPEGLLDLCRRFSASPATSWMVGDYMFDIQAGQRAGMRTVLMIGDLPLPTYAADADHVVRALGELLEIVGV